MNNGFPKRRPISDFSVDETGNLQKNAYVASSLSRVSEKGTLLASLLAAFFGRSWPWTWIVAGSGLGAVSGTNRPGSNGVFSSTTRSELLPKSRLFSQANCSSISARRWRDFFSASRNSPVSAVASCWICCSVSPSWTFSAVACRSCSRRRSFSAASRAAPPPEKLLK